MPDDHDAYSSKRKYDDPSPPPRRATGFSSGPPPASPRSAGGGGGGEAPSYNSVPPPPDEIQVAKQRAQEIAARLFNAAEAKRPRVENGDNDVSAGGGFSSSAAGDHRPSIPLLSSQGRMPQYSTYSYQGTSKKIEIPNGRVGVVIGRSGETIKYLQLQSGAKIQITRDMDADPNSQTRSVELSGTPEQISKAEQLINEVITEADSGASGTNSGRMSNAPQQGGEQCQMNIANNKVGLVIGRGGETIKSMQAKSGARIQVIPLHLPPGDILTERTLSIAGTKEQIEMAKQLVNEVISENRARNSGGYSQQGYGPPRPQANWAPPGALPMQQPGYGYMQPGAYSGAPAQHGVPQQPYSSYPPASGGYQTGWNLSTNPQGQQTASGTGTGYDYYNQQQQQPPVSGTASPAGATSYSHVQTRTYTSQGYGDSTYSQQTGVPQVYGHDGYSNYHTQGHLQGYSLPVSTPQTGYDNQQSDATPGYGSAANHTQHDGSGGASQVSPAQHTSAPATGSQPGYASQPPSSTTSDYPVCDSSLHSEYGVTSAPQPGYGTQPPTQGGYVQSAYGQLPQGQQPPTTAPCGQAPPSESVQAGYNQLGYSHGQPPAYTGMINTGYGQQQSYAGSYGSGSYTQQPAYSTEATTLASQDQVSCAPATATTKPTGPAPGRGSECSPS